MDKDLARIEKRLVAAGYVLVRQRTHRIWKAPGTGRIFVLPVSGSDWRTLRNVEAQLRRYAPGV